MATYYFDSVLGSDSTGNGSISLPWATYNAKRGSTTTGDTCLFKRGTTQPISTIYLAVRSGTSLAAPFKMAAYGEGANPIFTNPSKAWSYILDGSSHSYVTLEDLDFDCGNLAQSSIYIGGEGATGCTGWRVRRCRFYNSSTLYGIVVRKAVSSDIATAVQDIEFENCDFFNNGSSGIITSGATNVRVKRCRAWGNGYAGSAGGHGISFGSLRTTVTSGWTNTSGNIYSHSIGALEVNVLYVSAPSPYMKLAKNTGTPTTPALGEFGVSGTTLYVNIGSSPNGQSVIYSWGRCGDNLVEDCEAWGNLSSPNWTFVEGHGFAFDDFTEDSVMRRCYSHDNIGNGFSNNKGDRNTYESCLAINNGRPAVVVSPSDDVAITNLTAVGNNSNAQTEYAASIVYAESCTNGSIKNSAIVAKSSGDTYGIDIVSPGTGTVVDHCAIYGSTTRVRTITETNAVTGSANMLTGAGGLAVNSPLIGAGTHIAYGRDIERKQRPNPPSIGAYDVARLLTE